VKKFIKIWRVLCSFMLLLVLFSAMAMLSSSNAKQFKSGPNGEGRAGYYLLDLVGYNYTDRNIDSYSINGQGGGNVRLSSPTSGGSGIACCVKLSKDEVDYFYVRVRWQFDGCTYILKSSISGSVSKNIRSFYKESDVNVSRAIGVKPTHLEAHFYPDGSVKVQLTDQLSPPRLSLNEGRVDKSSFPRCKDDEKPE
jgi:hypothetical protein